MIAPEKAFVNLFWGQKDGGFPVIQMRIKTSLRTLQELLEFYKERIAIEKEYNKKLSKLASAVPLGSSEIGSLKIALEKLHIESGNMITQNQAFIRDIQLQNYEKLHHFYVIYQKNALKTEAHMQKLFQKRKDHALLLETAKEKFRVACGQQKSLALLCQTTWGKELEKNTAKLYKIQLGIHELQDTYQQAVLKYAEIHEIWVRDWSIALLNIYELEIERIQVCKLNCFAFCNHIASLCVDWDLAVDNSRTTFARVGAPKDVIDFVENYGTGNQIPVPPEYVDFLGGFDDEQIQRFVSAEFKDPDYSQILSRTFSTHSNVVGNIANSGNVGSSGNTMGNAGNIISLQKDNNGQIQTAPHSPVKPAANKSLPPIKEPLTPAGTAHNLLSPLVLPTNNLGEPLRKEPSHNSNYTSGAEDHQDVFDRNHRVRISNTLSNYSSPTAYSNHTGRSWSSPHKKLAHEMQKEINRRLRDASEFCAGSPNRASDPIVASTRKSVLLVKDFSMDFIAKALEDLNAGGDGDMNRFRRSVRLENREQTITPAYLQDDEHDTAHRHDSIVFHSPQRTLLLPFRLPPKTANNVRNTPQTNPGNISVADETLLHTVIKKPLPQKKEKHTKDLQRRLLLQLPTKSYVNLLAIVNKVTPVSRNKYETKAIAKYNYTMREEAELSLKKGWHMFVIYKQEDNWYVCELGDNCGAARGQVGLVPYNYIVEGDDAF